LDKAKWFRVEESALWLHVYLQPRASRDEIVGVHDDCLKIRLTTPPVDGRANQHLCQFLAKFFRVATQSVSIEKGELSRKKWVKIEKSSGQALYDLLMSVISLRK